MSNSNESGAATLTTPSSANTSSSTVPTKLCHIVKRADFDGYGFNLHSEKIKPGQYIGKVDHNSPASAAGLKEFDRIIEVNGVPIGSETHKQVVQRIKAISHEVRLLLIDADAPTEANNGSLNKNNSASNTVSPATLASINSNNNNLEEYQGGWVQQMPGASANISTISMVSTKRMSNSSSSNGSQSSATTALPVPVTPPTVPKEADVTDRGMLLKNDGDNDKSTINAERKSAGTKLNDENKLSNDITPPPRSATIASAAATIPLAVAAELPAANSNSTNKAGSLQLPMTAAEMRAKLMSKKKYDPKNESVDLKKKFEIIQKL